jgi:LacI family transcriptional regulator
MPDAFGKFNERLMKKTSITIADVAARARVSIGTASQALNGKAGVSPAAVEKVKKAAVELEYIPTIAARQLRDGRSSVLSLHVIIPENGEIHPSTWDFYFPIIQGFASIAGSLGFRSHLEFNNIRELKSPYPLLQYLRGYNVRGAAFIITSVGNYDGLLGLQENRIPVITIYARPLEQIPSICVDNFQASYRITRWLREIGHREICYIGGLETDFAAQDRLQGYCKGMEGNSFLHISSGTWDWESGSEQMKKLIADRLIPSAVFCANDHMAMGVLQACRNLCIPIPDRVSLVGFDDTLMAQIADPQLTSVRMPLFELGRQAAEQLIDESHEPFHRWLSAEPVIRQSVKVLKTA